MVQPFWDPVHEFGGLRERDGFVHSFEIEGVFGIGYAFPDRPGEQVIRLHDIADLTFQAALIDQLRVESIDIDLSRSGANIAGKQVCERALSAAALSHYGDDLFRINGEIEAFQDPGR